MKTCVEKYGYIPPSCDEDITIKDEVVSCKRCGDSWEKAED